MSQQTVYSSALTHPKDTMPMTLTRFPGGSAVKNLPANARDAGSIPGLGRSPLEGNGNSLQYSCLEKSHEQQSQAGCTLRGCKELDGT